MTTTYRDVNLNFKKHPGTHDVLKKADVESVKSSIKNILLGNPFDVPFNPHYGSAFRALLFELITPTTVAHIRRNVLLKLNEFEPRCVVNDLKILSKENSVDVELLFFVSGNTQLQTLTFFLERVR